MNFKLIISKKVKAKIIGGAFVMRYKSTRFSSSIFPFSVKNSSDNLFGGNIGCGIDISLSKSIIIFAEGKYTIHQAVEKNFLFEETSGKYFIPVVGLMMSF